MLRGASRWLPGYLRHAWRLGACPEDTDGIRDLLFCFVDHFEPFRGGVPRERAVGAVRQWIVDYTGAFDGLRDSDGLPPRHTLFYPQEDSDAECLELLAGFCRRGLGEVEIHLHHRGDSAAGLEEKLVSFRQCLRDRHGLLGADAGGAVRYGFIHGNWALCNSRPDGDWCGVNEELGVLARTGCYADFTFPSAPSPTQPRTVNAIYYARDLPGRPRSHDRGCLVAAGSRPPAADDGRLMLIQGPLALNWRRRKWLVLPRLENAEIAVGNLPTEARIGLWASQRIGVVGQRRWVFVKVHTHGCVAENRAALFGEPMRLAHEYLRTRFGDGQAWRLHYVSARELYNIARAAEAGLAGNPASYRDFEIARPPSADSDRLQTGGFRK